MITSLKDEDGRIIAYAEWRLYAGSGYETPNGEYVWINDCWVHARYRMKNKIHRITDEILKLVPTAKYVYFQRKDVNNKLHLYSVAQWAKRRISVMEENRGKL